MPIGSRELRRILEGAGEYGAGPVSTNNRAARIRGEERTEKILAALPAYIDKDTEDRTYVPGAHDTATSDSDSFDLESSVTDTDLEANSTCNCTVSGTDSGKVRIHAKLAAKSTGIQTPWSQSSGPPPTQLRLQVNSPGILIVWMIAMIVIASGLWASITAKALSNTSNTKTAGMTLQTPGIRIPANGFSQLQQCKLKGHHPDAILSVIAAKGIMHGQDPEPNV